MTNFKYALLRLMRNKANLFWILVFPIVLGCFFKIAFSNITASESFHTIPVAVVEGDNADATAFHTMIEQLSGDSEDAMLSATFCDDKKARTLLEKGKVDGIFYTTDTVELAVNSDLSDASINQSILQSLLTQYYLNRDLIVQILTTNPGNIESLVDSIGQSVDTRKEVSLTMNNIDTYDQYFYNLIAMACLYTAMGGINLAINNSANLSYCYCPGNSYDNTPWIGTAYDTDLHDLQHHVRHVLRMCRTQIRRWQDRTHVCRCHATVFLKRIDDGNHAYGRREVCAFCQPDQSGGTDLRQLLCAQ